MFRSEACFEVGGAENADCIPSQGAADTELLIATDWRHDGFWGLDC